MLSSAVDRDLAISHISWDSGSFCTFDGINNGFAFNGTGPTRIDVGPPQTIVVGYCRAQR